jgi:hypothetical protein
VKIFEINCCPDCPFYDEDPQEPKENWGVPSCLHTEIVDIDTKPRPVGNTASNCEEMPEWCPLENASNVKRELCGLCKRAKSECACTSSMW